MPIISGDIMTIRFAKLAIAAAVSSRLAAAADPIKIGVAGPPAAHHLHGREYA
jgi:hypothetical protein